MIEPTLNNARRYGLTYRQIQILSLLERRFGRAEMAKELGTSVDSVRYITVGMCETYECPARELPDKIQGGILNEIAGDKSLYKVLSDARRWISDGEFDPPDEWVDDLLTRIKGATKLATIGSSRVKSIPDRSVRVAPETTDSPTISSVDRNPGLLDALYDARRWISDDTLSQDDEWVDNLVSRLEASMTFMLTPSVLQATPAENS